MGPWDVRMLIAVSLWASSLVLMTLSVEVSGAQAEGYQFQRRYVDGDSYRYRVTSRVERNGMPAGKETAVSLHSVVVPRDGTPFERISWGQLESQDPSGRKIPSGEAEKVPPYEISLDEEGRVSLPELTIPPMVGMVTDLNTFMVAVSPRVGVQTLRRLGDSHTHSELLRGDFANGGTIILGQDCTELTLTLVGLTPETARIESRFAVPARECIAFRQAWMARRGQVSSNFQMIRKSSGTAFDVFWGTEAFTIVSEVRRRDGQLLRARMDNVLDLTMRMGCDAVLDACRGDYPVRTHRVVTLELLP